MSRFLERIGKVEPGEGRLVLLSGGTFFFLLFGYFLLRPLRDMYGVRGGIENLPYLTIMVVVAMIALNPVFGFCVSRIPRRRFLPLFYGFFIVNILAFFAIQAAPWGRSLFVGRVFFVWLSVFNLFINSVFWQVMADTWKPSQAKRLYGLVGVGGTAGALLGSIVVTQLDRIANVFGLAGNDIIPALFLVSACSIALAVVCGMRIWRRAPVAVAGIPVPRAKPLGGSAWRGFQDVWSSKYLRGICLYILLFTIIGQLFWYVEAAIIRDAAPDDRSRMRLFGWRNVADQGLTLIVQLFLTARIINWLGVGRTLTILPIVSIVGVGAVAMWPLFLTTMIVAAVRRASNFALAKPARESLFSVVSREEKYKAKAVIDTAVYRGGDFIGALILLTLPAGTAAIVPIAGIGAVLAAGWGGTGLWLGRRRRDLARKMEDPPATVMD